MKVILESKSAKHVQEQIIVYWPGMSHDIHDTVAKCSICLTHRHNNQKKPMIPHAIADRSWQKLRSDVFEHKGKPYLVVVAYYSKFIETSLMRDKTEGTIVTHMKSIFARHGIPEELVSDNMPYNSKGFKHFASDWGFKLTTSSPTYPQVNGVSEKAVQTIKRILKKISTLAIQWPFGVQKHPSDRNDLLPITALHESRH